MRKYVAAGLLAVLLLGVALRLLPLLRYDFWGVDTGEYYGICRGLVQTGHTDPADYGGFGFTYPYFHGLYVVVGSAALLTGAGLYPAFSLLVPVFGAMCALLVFLISHSIFRRPQAGLLAALFVGVVALNVYQTSRTMPASLGHFLLILCILLLVKSYDNPRFFLLLAPATLALVASHHLSIYFLLICALGIVILREFMLPRTDRAGLRAAGYLVFLMGAALLFWYGYVTLFIDRVVAPALPVSAYLLPAFLFGGLVALFGLVRIRRAARPGWRYSPKWRTLGWCWATVGIAAGLGLASLAYVTFAGVSNVSVLDKSMMLAFLPIVVFVSFAGIGVTYTDFSRSGIALYGAYAAAGSSFLAAIAIDSHEIFPDRHAEILMALVAILGGYGIYTAFSLSRETSTLRARGAAFALVLVMFGAMAATAYPPTTVLGGGEQGAYPKDTAGIIWARENAALQPDGVIAAENRLSSGLYGLAGLNATWYSAYDTFYAQNFTGAKGEMLALDSPSGAKRVDYIFLDESTKQNAILTPWASHEPISGPALAKFSSAPYVKIFDNGYCAMYAVDWGYS